MQPVASVNVENLPNVGYLVSDKDKKEKFYKYETHIHKQGPLEGVKVGAHKLYNDILTYYPKGFAGSKNSDFYEYLSLGMVPNIVGSLMLMASYGLVNHKFSADDARFANISFKQAAAGVILYAAGKWAFQKLSRTVINAFTGVNLDLFYTKKVNELPEPGQEKGLVRTQYPRVYDSVQFYRSDLLTKDGELNHNNAYYHDDRIVEKVGYKDKKNASNQMASEKIRGVKARATALENIGKYIVAATGVALGSQNAFGGIKIKQPRTILSAIKEGAIELWKGSDIDVKNTTLGKLLKPLYKHLGKGLIIASAVATFLTCLIPILGFKHKPDNMKSKVDTKKEYEVC